MRAALSSPFSAIVAVPSVATLQHLGRKSHSDDEEDEYEHYKKLVTTRLLVGFDLQLLNHCLVCYGFNPERHRRVAAKELARQLLQETDSEDSE